MKDKRTILFALCLILVSKEVYAGGAVARRRQMEQQRAVRQRQLQQQARIIAQQRAQAVAQQQAQIIAQQQAQVIAQRRAEAIAYQRAAVKHQVAAQIENIDQINLHMPPSDGATLNLNLQSQGPPVEVKAVATLNDVFSSLEASSQDWDLIVDRQGKEAVISMFIEQYRSRGITISQSPSVYAEMIDGMAQGSPEMLNLPFSKVLMVAAIMQYDYENGEDKDALALQVLGSYDAVRRNKDRLGL